MAAYPENRKEWEAWLETQLGVRQSDGRRLFLSGRFPITDLVESWRREFTPERGYSPDFVPALIRNQKGFLKWVLGNGPEPNWARDDNTQ